MNKIKELISEKQREINRIQGGVYERDIIKKIQALENQKKEKGGAAKNLLLGVIDTSSDLMSTMLGDVQQKGLKNKAINMLKNHIKQLNFIKTQDIYVQE